MIRENVLSSLVSVGWLLGVLVLVGGSGSLGAVYCLLPAAMPPRTLAVLHEMQCVA